MDETYVITEACIGVKDATCVDVCPAACIHTTPEAPQYYIDPEVCIACEQCVLVCPVNAIYLDSDVPDHLKHYIDINADFFKETKAVAEPLTGDQAASLIAAAGRYAEESGYDVAIAVVNANGEFVDSSQAHGVSEEVSTLALDKAYTAASLQVATHQLGRGAATPGVVVPDGFQHNRLVEKGGGYPVVQDQVVIGAIGVAGTPSPQLDLLCCQAGLAALR